MSNLTREEMETVIAESLERHIDEPMPMMDLAHAVVTDIEAAEEERRKYMADMKLRYS